MVKNTGSTGDPGENTMKARQEAIKSYIEERGEVGLSELTTRFSDWSEMTIRRDLAFLEEQRCIIRTKGGARVLPTSYGVTEDVYGEREKRNFPQKQEIARKAAELAEADSGIFLDAGSTSAAPTEHAAMTFTERLKQWKVGSATRNTSSLVAPRS